MATKVKFTDVWLRKLSAPTGTEVHYGDATCSGLSLKHTQKDVKSFSFTFRLGAKTGRVTIGRYPDISIRGAREKADEMRRAVANGVDPRRQKQEHQEQAKLTVEAMAGQFIEQYAKPKNKSWKQAESNLRLYLVPTLGSHPITDVRRRDIHDILDGLIKAGKGTAANRALAHMRKFFGWLVERDFLENSPADRIRKPFDERSRDRELTDDEIRLIWHASEALSGPYRAWLRLSLLCGQREVETACMRRSQIRDGTWHLASADTKNKSIHLIPLSRQALNIVEELLAQDGEYLLTSGRIGDQPINGFSRAKVQINRLSGVTDWKFHDLRAATATNLGKLGYDRALIMKVLNHKDSGVTARYDRYSYLDEKREALQKWADTLDDIIG